MNTIDLIILFAALIGFILGFKDGFLRKLIGVIGFVAAVFLAAYFKTQVGRFIESTFSIEYYLAEIMAALLIFFLTVLVFSILKRIIHPFDKINSLINQIVGGVVGILQLLIFLSAVFLLLNIFNIPDKNTRNKSLFYEQTYSIIPSAFNLLKDYTPSTEEIIKNYINEKDTLQ
ncbi:MULTISPECIES: CvpA family protein [Ignavibacterium]|uniref:CvpA family protein n=1 Tax=Ignavibacterium TaxID=795750 RepID=UPI0025BDEDB0|nr:MULTISPECIES: CvpA family protein [Ignavibacterium]MBI5662880.1 CvpA family protein [Ignavibacterium album]